MNKNRCFYRYSGKNHRISLQLIVYEYLKDLLKLKICQTGFFSLLRVIMASSLEGHA